MKGGGVGGGWGGGGGEKVEVLLLKKRTLFDVNPLKYVQRRAGQRDGRGSEG
ncbi:unnamed protein product, partial [Lota lota]